MAHGASARGGVYPHREATTAYALAVDRGNAEIVRIIEEAEAKTARRAERPRRAGRRRVGQCDPLW